MKRMVFGMAMVLFFASCGNATDGDATTDTTTLPVDTGGSNAANDTADHINTSTGTYPGDSATNFKGDVRSSSPTDTASRKTTPGNRGQGLRQ